MSRAFWYLSELMRLPHRGTGTPQEGAAADMLSDWLRRMEYDVASQPFRAPRDSLYLGPGLTMLAMVLAVEAVRIAPWAPILLCLLILIPLLGELVGSRINLDLILPMRPSQNVLARRAAPGDHHVRVVLSAHYDTQRGSLLFHPRFVRSLQMYFMCLYGVLGATVLALAAHALWQPVWLGPLLRTAQVLLLANGGVLVCCAFFGKHVPGANDNGSGVAVCLAVAERFQREPIAGLDLVIVLTGAEEVGMRGMQRYVAGCALKSATTRFIVLDNIGAGTLHMLGGEGMLTHSPYSAKLMRFCEAAGQTCGVPLGHRKNLVLPTDGAAPLRAGYETLTLIAFGKDGELPHYHWRTDLLQHIEPAILEQAESIVWRVMEAVAAEVPEFTHKW